MYLIIPAAIFVASVVAIWIVISRKFVYLKKLDTEAINNPPATIKTFWASLFPEVVAMYGQINWSKYRIGIIVEFEKMFRRIHLLFLKIESATHNFSLRLRKITKRHEQMLVQKEEVIMEEQPQLKIDPKEEEQNLIMEIAKNPKAPILYKRLGDIYLSMGDKENALLSFKTVLDLDPENWYAKGKIEKLSR